MSKYMDDYIASILARPKPTEPYMTFNEWRCPCGAYLYSRDGCVWTCDGTGYDGKKERHAWKRDPEWVRA